MPAACSRSCVHHPPSPRARNDPAVVLLLAALEFRCAVSASRSGGPPIRHASVDSAAPAASKSRAANMPITAGHTSRRPRVVPSRLMNANAQGIRHPSFAAASMTAPAGPLIDRKGLSAIVLVRTADFHAATMSSLQSPSSHAALAHSINGSISKAAPGS